MKSFNFRNLFIVLLISCSSVAKAETYALYDFVIDGIYYNVIDSKLQTVEVSHPEYYSGYSGAITIPEKIVYDDEVYQVIGIGANAFRDCTRLTNVTIPNSVTSIGDYAFYDCSGLTSITIPNSVTSIGSWAFDGTAWYDNQPDGVVYAGKVLYKYKVTMPFFNPYFYTNITIKDGTLGIAGHALSGCAYYSFDNIEIPNSVTNIGAYAFYGCGLLANITIPNSVTSIGSCAFDGTAWYDNQPDGPLYINNVFYKYKGTMPDNTNITIKDGALEIVGYAFTDCDGLTGVTIPNSVKNIGTCAFENCDNLTKIEIPNGVTTIGCNAFGSCMRLASVTIPNSVTSIGYCAFSGCWGLKEVHISDIAAWYNIEFEDYDSNPLYYANNLYLNGELVTNLVIPDDVTAIKNHAFIGCSSLVSITIPNSVRSIGHRAFDSCMRLTSVTIPNSVTSIGWGAFDGCSSLTSITIPNSVTSIGGVAFKNCDNLTKIEIPNGVTTIGYNAFGSCMRLTSVTIPNSVTSIGWGAFNGCSSLKEVHISNISAWCNIDFEDGYSNPLYYAKNLYLNGELVTNLVIPTDVTAIKKYAFYNCSSLASITIPNSVTSIGEYAFEGCNSLASITIPNSVTSIGRSTFYNCSSLASITIPNSVTSIGNCAFYGCMDITEIYAMSETPAMLDYGTFSMTDISFATLYVPVGSKEAYQAADYWNEFGNIVEMDFTAIEDTLVDDTLCGVNDAYYDLQGRRVGEPAKGCIYIHKGKKVQF